MITIKYLDKCCNRQYTIGKILANWCGVTERNVIKYLCDLDENKERMGYRESEIGRWAKENKMEVDDLAKYLRKVKHCIGKFSYAKPVIYDEYLEETTCRLNIGNGIVLSFHYMLNRPEAYGYTHYNETTNSWE